MLKVGVHAGPSVVVTLNDRLDYFGSTVNMAARLQGQSAGDDIVLSHAVAADPAVQEILATVPKRHETVALKGFEEPVGFVRLLSQRVPFDPLGERILERGRDTHAGAVGGPLEPVDQIRRD